MATAAAVLLAKEAVSRGWLHSTSATCPARPGPKRPRGLAARSAATTSPPSAGMSSAARPSRLLVPIQPCVAS